MANDEDGDQHQPEREGEHRPQHAAKVAATLRPIPPSLGARAVSIARDFRDLARDHLELAVLEAQQAGMVLAKLLGAAVFVAVLVATGWLGLVASAIVWATAQGVPWTTALAIAGVFNLVAALVTGLWVRKQADQLPFAATLRQLHKDSDAI